MATPCAASASASNVCGAQIRRLRTGDGIHCSSRPSHRKQPALLAPRECVRAVVAAIASAWAMSPHINETSRGKPLRRSIVMIRNTECNVIVSQQVKNVVFVPTGMAKFEGVAPARREELEKSFDPAAIFLELRRQLKHRTGPTFSPSSRANATPGERCCLLTSD